MPDLPGKSLFSFSNEDFLERRRRGLQVFLDKSVLILFPKQNTFQYLEIFLDISFHICAGTDTSVCWQSVAHDSVSVRQPAPPLPADTTARWTHPGLRAGPHALHRDRCHPHLCLVQSGLGSGPGGRCDQGAKFECSLL